VFLVHCRVASQRIARCKIIIFLVVYWVGLLCAQTTLASRLRRTFSLCVSKSLCFSSQGGRALPLLLGNSDARYPVPITAVMVAVLPCYLPLTSLNSAISLYQQNRHIFATFEKIEQQSKLHERHSEHRSAQDRREKFGERNTRCPAKMEAKRSTARPPWEEKRRLFDTHKLKVSHAESTGQRCI